MGAIFYLINYTISCICCVLFICWIFYLAKSIKYRKSSCDNYEAEVNMFKGNTWDNKKVYTYKYVIDNINYFGEIKTNETYNIGDRIEILVKRNNRSESIIPQKQNKLPIKALIYFISWVVCNVLFVLLVLGQYMLYDM